MRRTAKKDAMPDEELAEAIRRAQKEPGLADLMSLLEQSDEAATLERERRELAVITTVVSATATAG